MNNATMVVKSAKIKKGKLSVKFYSVCKVLEDDIIRVDLNEDEILFSVASVQAKNSFISIVTAKELKLSESPMRPQVNPTSVINCKVTVQ